MNEGPTQYLPDRRSFEQRVFARFDLIGQRFESMEARFEARFNAIDSRFDLMDARFEARFDRFEARLDGLDVRVHALESRALDTKPIWERALAEILEVKTGVEDLNRKIDVLSLDVIQVRADQRRVEKRMDTLESGLQ